MGGRGPSSRAITAASQGVLRVCISRKLEQRSEPRNSDTECGPLQFTRAEPCFASFIYWRDTPAPSLPKCPFRPDLRGLKQGAGHSVQASCAGAGAPRAVPLPLRPHWRAAGVRSQRWEWSRGLRRGHRHPYGQARRPSPPPCSGSVKHTGCKRSLPAFCREPNSAGDGRQQSEPQPVSGKGTFRVDCKFNCLRKLQFQTSRSSPAVSPGFQLCIRVSGEREWDFVVGFFLKPFVFVYLRGGETDRKSLHLPAHSPNASTGLQQRSRKELTQSLELTHSSHHCLLASEWLGARARCRRQREIPREIFHPLVHFPNAHNS
nr:uncharacterized protein LOC127487458 [Oryctolagus cuniculus]